jgi:hypothetical protein
MAWDGGALVDIFITVEALPTGSAITDVRIYVVRTRTMYAWKVGALVYFICAIFAMVTWAANARVLVRRIMWHYDASRAM